MSLIKNPKWIEILARWAVDVAVDKLAKEGKEEKTIAGKSKT
jgi:hypothetical protein